MPDVSIAISARDNFSDAITTMRNSNQAFDKDLTGTMEKLNSLNQNKITLKVDADKARADLKEAEKQFAATGSAADKMALELANGNYENARRNLDLVSKNARQAEHDILSMTDAVEKSDNRASKITDVKESGNSGISKVMHGLAGAGMTKMIGDSLSGAADAYISSAFSDEAGNMAGGVLNGMTSGAALGAMTGTGLPGMAIGAAVGGITGVINGAVKNFKSQDDAFKSIVQDSYNDIKNTETSDLNSGTGISEARERDLRAFSSILDGNTKAADRFQKSLIEVGRTPPFNYDTVASLSKGMLGLGDSTETAMKKINDLADASSALGWSSSDASTISSTLDAALANGSISSRVLKTLDKSGLHAEEAIAEAFHIKGSDVAKKIDKLDATSVINSLYNYMGRKYAGASKTMANTYEGQLGIKQSYDEDQQAAMGKGYENSRTPALAEHNKMMSGSVGKDIEQANTMLGQFKADLENTEEELVDNAKASITSGIVRGTFSKDKNQNSQIKQQLQKLADDYKTEISKANSGDLEAKQKAARDVEEAVIVAENAYKLSDGYQLEIKGNLDLITKIQGDDALNTAYYNEGYNLGQRLSKGVAAGYNYDVEKGIISNPVTNSSAKDPKYAFGGGAAPGTQSYDGTVNPVYGREAPKSNKYAFGGTNVPGAGHATGINRVPYNNFPALLHEDERVLTGVEARSQKSKQGVLITGNTFNVRQESDIDAIASAIYRKLQKAEMVTT